MTESEFLEASEALMDAVEDAVDAAGIDCDCERAGNVLTIEADSGDQVVVNRHTPTQQMWLACRRGGRHYEMKGGAWVDTRSGVDFWQGLEEALSFACGSAVALAHD